MGMFNSPGTSGINSTTDASQNYRGLLVAKIDSVNIPTSGPLNGRPVYGWTEQIFDISNGNSVAGQPARKGIYTSATVFDNCLLDLNDKTIAIGSCIWIRMKGLVAGYTVYETSSPASGLSYFSKLTGSGTGVDGGIAWAGLWQKEVGGVVVSGNYVGGTDAVTPVYCMYPTLADNGSPGAPEIGDVNVTLPDPLKAGRWEFQPKPLADAQQGCQGCGWLADVDQANLCVEIAVYPGFGRCDCIVPDPINPLYPDTRLGHLAIYTGGTIGGYLMTKMLNTCCGCGGAIFRILDTDALTAQLEIRDVHVSCQGGSGSGSGGNPLFTMFMNQVCCGVDSLGRNYVQFASNKEQGPDACDDTVAPCNNVFQVRVTCTTCPLPICNCCCLEASAQAWWFDLIGSEYSSNLYNGFWVFSYTGSETACSWTAVCGGITSTIVYDPESSNVILTHGGSTYTLPIASWNCNGNNSMPKTSGSDGPATLAVNALVIPNPPGITQPCDFPDSLTMSVASAGCPIMNGAFALTRTSATTWAYSNPTSDPTVSQITSMGFQCIAGIWLATVSAQCGVSPSGPSQAYTATTSGNLPDLQDFDPLEVVWVNQSITGLHPSVTPGCCDTTTDLTISITE